MIISIPYATWLLDEAMKLVDAPAGCGAILEGSIAAGFGNDTSDVDFLLVTEGDYEHPTMPTIVFVDGRRVEVRMSSVGQIRARIARVLAVAERGRRGLLSLPEDELNRCERLSGAVVLRNAPMIEALRAPLGTRRFQELVTEWFRARAIRSARYAVAMLALVQDAEAVIWARTALLQGAKAWAATQGETYLERKWLAPQLARLDDPVGLRQRFWPLATSATALSDPRGHVRECLGLIAEFGVGGCSSDTAMVRLDRPIGVTTWPLGDRVHVLRGRSDVFVLGAGAARVWRSLVFGVPVPEVARRSGVDAATTGQIIAELHNLGLVALRWSGGSRIRMGAPSNPPPKTSQPILTIRGALPDDGAHITLLPIPARRFAAAGMQCVWGNIMIENSREDMLGALAAGQWGTFRTTAHRMLRKACNAVLSAYGVNPLPPEDEAPLHVSRLGHLPQDVRDEIRALAGGLQIDDRNAAEAALATLDALMHRIRAATGASIFPSSFDSADEWRRTLEIGYDWVRLGGYLDSDFPLDEARDLIASGGRQPGEAG